MTNSLSSRGSSALSISFRPMTVADAAAVAGLHRSAMPDGFFVRLGPRFLAAYYRCIVDSDGSWSVVADLDGQVVGYLTGVVDPRAFQASSARRIAALAPRGFVAVLCRPKLLARFVRTRALKYAARLRRAVGPSRTEAHAAPAVLSYVAVDETVRGHGIATDLVRSFVSDVARAGGTRAVLVTPLVDDPAVLLYRRLGWRDCGRTTTPDGKMLRVMEWIAD
ncbi:MAG: GNAT family N-acetyltransferase [Sporichthyaceae bacterium]